MTQFIKKHKWVVTKLRQPFAGQARNDGSAIKGVLETPLFYFTRYKALPPFFGELPDKDLNIIVMIPCYDDEFVFETLHSLDNASPVQSKIEVIVVVNSGERTPNEVVERNRTIFSRLQRHAQEAYYTHFRLLPIWIEGIAKKKAGVGFARKVGMDEAVRRFAAINRPQGLIVSLDADTLVAENYLHVAEKAFKNTSAHCFTFQFQHCFDPDRYSDDEIRAGKLYEIYLRYYRLALKMVKVPFAVHTIGSCFAVRAEAYIKLGGMPVRQAGEDFYFLQKAVKMHPVCEMSERIVFPAPRISERVPFGTSVTIRKIIAEGHYDVCNFELFKLLKVFYDLFPALEQEDAPVGIPSGMMDFIGTNVWNDSLAECRRYSSSSSAFLKRMYNKFDAFFIVKFLHSFDEKSAFPPIDVLEAGKTLLSNYGIKQIDNLYEQILALDSAH